MNESNDTSLSVAGMVLGIVSIVSLLGPGFSGGFWLCLLMSLVGVVLSAMGAKRNPAGRPGHGMAVAGLTLNIVVLALAVIMMASCAAVAITSLGAAYYL